MPGNEPEAQAGRCRASSREPRGGILLAIQDELTNGPGSRAPVSDHGVLTISMLHERDSRETFPLAPRPRPLFRCFTRETRGRPPSKLLQDSHFDSPPSLVTLN